MALYGNWNPSTVERVVLRPQAVQSKLILLEPRSQPTPPPKAQPTPQPAPQPDRAAQERRAAEEAAARKRAEEERQRVQEQARLQARKRAEEEAARRQAEERAREQERQERLDALSQSAFQDALQEEASELAALDAQADAEVAQSYRQGIYQAVVANWSRPPSARNRMEAKLLVELVPTGDVVSVTVVESSGNVAFDRSAEAAVRKARRFEVPKEPEVFERYFRRFTLLFRPEDLLR